MDQPHLWFSTGMGTVHYRYWHSRKVPILVWHFNWFSTSMGSFNYWYWHPNMVPVLTLAFLNFGYFVVPVTKMANMYLESVPVWAHSITRTGIKLCPYQYWHFCTFVRYQYWHGPLPVLALNGASTGIGIFAVLSNTSIGTVQYQYCHYLVLVPVLAFWYFCPMPVLAWYITGTGIKW